MPGDFFPPRTLAAFRKRVWAHYRAQGRHALPWRKTHDPYRILVSEVMLQQTQVARVVPFYHAFLKRFPTVRALAQAPLADVLRAWQGLGYSRRAKFLHEAAQVLIQKHRGKIPRTEALLLELPGIGTYTAAMIVALAYDAPAYPIETNIRTALIHHFFPQYTQVTDRELRALLKAMMPDSPRAWYLALMDYGAYLKKNGVRNNIQHKHYVRQSRFKGSTRELRGAIMRALAEKPYTEPALAARCGAYIARFKTQMTALQKEGLIRKQKKRWTLG